MPRNINDSSHSLLLDPDMLAIVRNGLFETVLQNGWRRNGFFTLLNRALVAMPHTLVPIIFQRGEAKLTCPRSIVGGGNSVFQLILNPLYDRVLADQFRVGQLDGCLVDGKYLDARWHNDLISLLGTDLYLLCFRIDMAQVDTKMTGELLRRNLGESGGRGDRENVRWRTLQALLEKPAVGADTVSSVAQAIRSNAAVIVNASTRQEKFDELLRLTSAKEEAWVTDLLRKTRSALEGVFDRVYELYAQSPLLESECGCAPNVMFFWKVFDRDNLRCAAYAYDTALVIPPRQKADLVAALYSHLDVLADETRHEPPVGEQEQKAYDYVRTEILAVARRKTDKAEAEEVLSKIVETAQAGQSDWSSPSEVVRLLV